MYRIILASESPKKRNLKTMGIPFEAMASNVNEEGGKSLQVWWRP